MTSDHGKGFTEESLNMLKTAEGQTNAVFACFGSAAQHAQLFEQGLARFLSIYNRCVSGPVNMEDFEGFESNLSKRTMGQLLRELLRYVRLEDNPEVQKRFQAALDGRNFLMHHFFIERNHLLGSEEGRMRLLVEILAIEQTLEAGRVTINAMRIAMCETLKIPDEFLEKR